MKLSDIKKTENSLKLSDLYSKKEPIENTFEGSVGQQMLFGGLRGLSSSVPGVRYAVNYYDQRLKGKSHGQAIVDAENAVKEIESVKLPSRTARFTELGSEVAPTLVTMNPFIKGAGLIPGISPSLKLATGVAGYGGASAILRGENPVPAAATSGLFALALGPTSRMGSSLIPKAIPGAERIGSAAANMLLSKIVNPQDNESMLLYGSLGGIYPGKRYGTPKFMNRENIAQKINQGVIGARKGQFKHGNPPLTIAKEGIVFNNLDDGLIKTESAIQKINADIQSRLESTSQTGLLRNYESALKPLYELKRKLNKAPDVNKEKIKNINNIIMNLKGYTINNVGNIAPITKYPLRTATPLDAYKVKQTAHQLAGTSYDSPLGGSDVSSALREVNRNLVNMISQRVGRIQGIDGRYIKDRLKVESDLIEAKSAISNSIAKDKVSSEQDLFRKLRLWGGGFGFGAGFHAGGPVGAVIGSISGAQIEKLLISPKFRTRVAAWLVKQPKQRQFNLLNNFPQLRQLFNERGSVIIPGKENFIQDFTKKHNSAADVWMSQEQQIKLKNLIDSGAKVKSVTKELSTFQNEKNYDVIENIKERYKKIGYKVFAEESNMGEQIEIIFYKPKVIPGGGKFSHLIKNKLKSNRGSIAIPGGGPVGQAPFYSKLEREISNFPQEKFTAGQIQGYLHGKVKTAELENAGLQNIPKDKSLTKTEVLNIVKQSTPEIKDVKERGIYRDYSLPGGSNYREYLAVLNLPKKEIVQKVGPNRYNFSNIQMKEVNPVRYGKGSGERGLIFGYGYQGDYNELKSGLTQKTYSNLEHIGKNKNIIWERITVIPKSVPKGTSNKLLVEGIDASGNDYKFLSDPGKLEGPGRRVMYFNGKPSPLSNYFSGYDDIAPMLEVKRESSTVKTLKAVPNLFSSGHYSSPNTLFHYRLKDRVGDKGDKILFVEEIQSDWAKQARHGTAKNYPLLKNWHELAAKKILALAEKEGYDGVAWTPGQVQSDRWSLGKVLKTLKYDKASVTNIDGWDPVQNRPIPGAIKRIEWKISGTTKDGQQFHRFIFDSKLEDYVGKDIAAIIRKRQHGTLGGHGKEFPVGPRWPYNLYDEMLPHAIEKYTGGNVENINLKIGGILGLPIEGQRMERKKVQGIILTDSVKEKIRKGFELFGVPAGIAAGAMSKDEN